MSRAITVSFSEVQLNCYNNKKLILDNTNKFSGPKDFFLSYCYYQSLNQAQTAGIVEIWNNFICLYHNISLSFMFLLFSFTA